MSEREEQDFLTEYLTWMGGPGLDLESLHVYNFGYDRPLPFPSIALTPDTNLTFNLQTSGIHAQSRRSIVVVGERKLGRFGEIMSVVDRIREETQALPFAIFLQTEDSIKLENMSSHHMRETPGLVGILSSDTANTKHPIVFHTVDYLQCQSQVDAPSVCFWPYLVPLMFHLAVLDRPCQSSVQILIIPFRFKSLVRGPAKTLHCK